jgi:hypothetical protein
MAKASTASTDAAVEAALKEGQAIGADVTLGALIQSREELFGGFNSQVYRYIVGVGVDVVVGGADPEQLRIQGEPVQSFIVKVCTKMPGNTSFANEQWFYTHASTILPGGPTGLRIPIIYGIKEATKSLVFVMEDLRVGCKSFSNGSIITSVPQQVGCKYTQAAVVVAALARFHAHNWVIRGAEPSAADANGGFVRLESLCPYAVQDGMLDTFANMMAAQLDDFAEYLGMEGESDEMVLKADDVRTVDSLARSVVDRFVPCVQTLRANHVTLLHGDARAANYFFEGTNPSSSSMACADDSMESVSVVAIDWQGFNIGSGPAELAYFMSMSVQHQGLAEHESDLLRLYYSTVLETHAGSERAIEQALTPDSYSFEVFCHEYYLGVCVAVAVPLLTTKLVNDGRKYSVKPTAAPHMQTLMQTALRAYTEIGPMLRRWASTASRHALDIQRVLAGFTATA